MREAEQPCDRGSGSSRSRGGTVIASNTVDVDGYEKLHKRFGGRNGTFGSESPSSRAENYHRCVCHVLSPLAAHYSSPVSKDTCLSTSYSLKWENGWIMRVQAPQLKSHGVDTICLYKKSEHSKEGKKSHFSKAQNLTTCL